MDDGEILDWLEELFKSNGGHWPLVSIQTIPEFASIAASNYNHGDEAGLVTAKTLRSAVRKASNYGRKRVK